MNEGGDNSKAPQVQGNTSQSMRPVSAVGAGFDANKLGNSQRTKKIKNKKSKTEKVNTSVSKESSQKRPVWFWVILVILGVTIIGIAIWGIVMLSSSRSNNEEDSSVELILMDSNASENDSNAVENYTAQLQQIYDSNSEMDDNAKAEKISATVKKTLSISEGQRRKNELLLAQMTVLSKSSNYDGITELINEINVDALTLQNQLVYYNLAYMYYIYTGERNEARRISEARNKVVIELCSQQECI